MSEFPNPCPAGGVFADPNAPQDSEGRFRCDCGRYLPLSSDGRFCDHSRLDAFLVLGLPSCPVCREDIEDDACDSAEGFVHPWCVALSDAELRAAGCADAAADRFDRETFDAA